MFLKLVSLSNKKNRAFTLIEVMTVICILAVIMALAIPAIGGYYKNSKAQTNLANAKMIYNAASGYLGSNPSAKSVTMTNLLDDNYLPYEPTTAGKNGFELSIVDGKPVVTWTAETDIAPESGHTYPPAS